MCPVAADPRQIPGARVNANTVILESEAQCAWCHGSLRKSKRVWGTALEVVIDQRKARILPKYFSMNFPASCSFRTSLPKGKFAMGCISQTGFVIVLPLPILPWFVRYTPPQFCPLVKKFGIYNAHALSRLIHSILSGVDELPPMMRETSGS